MCRARGGGIRLHNEPTFGKSYRGFGVVEQLCGGRTGSWARTRLRCDIRGSRFGVGTSVSFLSGWERAGRAKVQVSVSPTNERDNCTRACAEGVRSTTAGLCTCCTDGNSADLLHLRGCPRVGDRRSLMWGQGCPYHASPPWLTQH